MNSKIINTEIKSVENNKVIAIDEQKMLIELDGIEEEITDDIIITPCEDSSSEAEDSALQQGIVSLPVINTGDTTAVILQKNNIALVAMVEANRQTRIIEKISITPVVDDEPCVSIRKSISFTKKELFSSKDYTVMKKLYNFDIGGITQDDLKLAYDRLKEFMDKGESVDLFSSTVDFLELYREIMHNAMTVCKQQVVGVEQKMVHTRGQSKAVPAYKKENNNYGVHTDELKEILEDTGCKMDDLCRGLTHIARLKQIEPLVIRADKSRWPRNLSDGRYYFFRYDPIICNEKFSVDE